MTTSRESGKARQGCVKLRRLKQEWQEDVNAALAVGREMKAGREVSPKWVLWAHETLEQYRLRLMQLRKEIQDDRKRAIK